MSGKGSRPRPVDRETFAREWERIFAPKTTTTYDVSLMREGEWTYVPIGGTVVGVDVVKGSITIEVDGQ